MMMKGRREGRVLGNKELKKGGVEKSKINKIKIKNKG